MPLLTPDPIIDSIVEYRKSKILMVAAYLGLFDELKRPTTAAAVSKRRKLHPRSTEILLDSLTATGYLIKRGSRYRNAPLSAQFLVSGSPRYLGDNLKYQEIIWEAWGELRQSVSSGGAARPLEYWLKDHAGFTQEYIRGMENIAQGPSREIAAAVELGDPKLMLDVGAGPGTYSAAFLTRHPGMRADLLDLPGTLKITRSLLPSRGEAGARMRLVPGDYKKADFGRERYDLALLSHITHDEGPATNAMLLRKCYTALKPGGKAVVHDFTVSKDRTRPLFGALFSVHMLAYTESGRTYTVQEYRRWMTQAGFSRIRVRRIAAASRNATRIVVGVK